jgi:hypothetical protein
MNGCYSPNASTVSTSRHLDNALRIVAKGERESRPTQGDDEASVDQRSGSLPNMVNSLQPCNSSGKYGRFAADSRPFAVDFCLDRAERLPA